MDEDNIEELPEPQSSKSELSILLNSKFDEFKRSRDQILSKLDSEQYDVNKNTVPLSTSRSTSKISSRPSL